MSVVRTAVEINEEEATHDERYDRVYCVFDRDSHTNFDAASERAESEGFRLARSWPCFEYWLLLHYVYSRAPFGHTQGRNPCGNCIRTLREHLNEYEKAQPGLFDLTQDRLPQAKARATRALADAIGLDEPNSSTEIHDLVEYLERIKEPVIATD